MLDELMTVSEAAKFLGVSRSTLGRWNAQGKLCTVTDPKTGVRYYSRERLEDVLRQADQSDQADTQ